MVQRILVIEASHNYEETGSRYISRRVQERFEKKYSDAIIVCHDLAKNPPPHLSGTMLHVMTNPQLELDESQQKAIELSDKFCDELLSSDILLISMPMWNWGVPSAVKAWIDHIVRPQKTFHYTKEGIKGHINHARAVVVVSTGAVYSNGPLKGMDHTSSYMHGLLTALGFERVDIIYLEGTKIDPETSLKNAEEDVERLEL
ncbi:LAQU0S32e00122g1_1 [Lachancea quebecensis]|uniref:FMN-dependent NADH-azoreductase n=1 Tax=Lachancea quebecensis TaxID=1654605 RepID=A0A0P1KXX7_9SACH|nr:LAQU0S32e00122g1_1 [Lachancea quebecensis]